MKQIDSYWVDANGNKWSCLDFTEEDAQRHADSMRNCTDCTDCVDCSNCVECYNCKHCIDCSACGNCDFCVKCQECRNCYVCVESTECTESKACIKCKRCYACNHITGFDDNPHRYGVPCVAYFSDGCIWAYWLPDGTVQINASETFKSLTAFSAYIDSLEEDNPAKQVYFRFLSRVTALI